VLSDAPKGKPPHPSLATVVETAGLWTANASRWTVAMMNARGIGMRRITVVLSTEVRSTDASRYLDIELKAYELTRCGKRIRCTQREFLSLQVRNCRGEAAWIKFSFEPKKKMVVVRRACAGQESAFCAADRRYHLLPSKRKIPRSGEVSRM